MQHTFQTGTMETTAFHLLSRMHKGTVYPAGVARDTYNPYPTQSMQSLGHGFLAADKWYDVNGVFSIIYRNGYTH